MPMLGIMASQISGHLWAPNGAYDSIATGTGNGTSSTITFSSIPQTYTHLQVRILGRSTAVAQTDYIYCWINGDTTTSKYAYHYLRGDGTTATAGGSAASTSAYAGFANASSATAGMFGVSVIDILDYTNTNKYRTTRSLSGEDRNTVGGNVWYFSNLFMDSTAVTSLQLKMVGGNWDTNSHVALYGIKGV